MSPHGEVDSPPRKRRRTALSCFNCRRRKLQCDRNTPFCSRCLKTGLSDSCGYDHPSPNIASEESSIRPTARNGEPHTHANGENPRGLGLNSHLKHSDAPPQNTVAERTKENVVKTDSRLAVHEDKTRQLENRLVALETLVNSPQGQTNGSESPERQPAVKRTRPCPTSEARHGKALDSGATLRRRHFETQFYGASHPSSIIGQVHTSQTYQHTLC